MRNSKLLFLFCAVMFMGVITVANSQSVVAEEEEWTESFEAFKPAEDAKYHQRNTGGVDWMLFHDQPNEDTKGKPGFTDFYWIEGEKSWINRIEAVEGQCSLSYQKPANLADENYHAPCSLCNKPTYFWLDSGLIDAETATLINADYPDWKKDDGVCRRCNECYALRAGKWYDGNMATTTDLYTIGFNKSSGVLDYFKLVK